jgi:hypothetical protein
MSVGLFTDKEHTPTAEEVGRAVGPRQAAWDELVSCIRESYSNQDEFRFYGRNFGWALRFRKSGRALASLYPTGGGFTVQVILGADETKKALDLGLGKHVRQIIEEAHPYPEGRWLFIPVGSERDILDIRRLLALKGGTKRPRKQAASVLTGAAKHKARA